MIPDDVKRFLDQRGVPFRACEHPLRVTAQEIAQSAHIPGRRFAKTVVIKHRGQMMLAVLPADEKVDLDALGSLLGDRVELASEPEFAERFPGCEVGAMPPFGDLYEMPVIADAHLAREAAIAFSAGTHTDVIEMSWDDFRALTHPRVVDYGRRYH